MSKYLISVSEVFRVDSEKESQDLIQKAKNDNKFQLAKYISEYKERKLKGEICDQYWKVTLNKVFNDIKDPDCTVDITYTKENGVFPSPVERATTDEDEEDEDEPTW